MNSEILDRLPPHDLSAEKGVLGSVMLDPSRLGRVSDIVSAADFYAAANATLFQTLLDLDAARLPIDGTILLSRLRADNNVDLVGGAAYLAEVIHAVPYAENAEYHARIVKDTSLLRGIIQASTESLREAYELSESPRDVLGRAEQRLQALDKRRGSELATASQLATEVGDHIDAVAERGKHLGLSIGLHEFDEIVGGLFGGELIILAARPSVGKSAMASQIADHVASSGHLVYFASLEMSGRELAMRSICAIAQVDSRRIRTNRMDADDRSRLADGMADFAGRKLLVDSRPDLTVESFGRTVRRLAGDGLAIAVVDYLGLLTPSDAKVKRYEQVSHETRMLKLLAREVQIPLVVLCQLNRQPAEEKGHPQLHHLRESGSIEQDADVVLFLHRPEEGVMVPNKDKANGSPKFVRADWPAELIVAKNRSGPTCRISLDWEPKYTRFACWNSPREHAKDAPGFEPAFSDFGGQTEMGF
ncbi:replicative DNA helicase [Candidatus Pacearchaeota archaeon]|jgi:replicative DNA helicase|nr:replicative DNA helicase [Candidatus Pacearchaeota archaeon]